jgi:glycosyltransferase involved in cell wall biosynthesis
MTKISILIATYNRAELVKQAVISVLAQSFEDLEVIVVDDGSSDHTEKAIQSLEDPRIKYIYQSNQGAASAWNRGFQASEGDYIGILGDDDAYLPDGLAPLARLLDEQPETGVAEPFHFRPGNLALWLPVIIAVSTGAEAVVRENRWI